MKRYTSFKEVDAAKIKAIGAINTDSNTAMVLLADDESTSTRVTAEWLAKHSNNGSIDLVGGYLVRYADGYESWSPAEAFESGYKEITNEGHEALKQS